jgi:hypothetical protein
LSSEHPTSEVQAAPRATAGITQTCHGNGALPGQTNKAVGAPKKLIFLVGQESQKLRRMKFSFNPTEVSLGIVPSLTTDSQSSPARRGGTE